MYQSDKTRSRGKPWGLTCTGEKCTQDDRWTWGERVGRRARCCCVWNERQFCCVRVIGGDAEFWAARKIPPQVLEVPLSPKILTSWIKKKGWVQCEEVKTALIDSFILTTDKKKTVCNVKGVVVVMHPKRITRSQRYFQIRARRRDF